MIINNSKKKHQTNRVTCIKGMLAGKRLIDMERQIHRNELTKLRFTTLNIIRVITRFVKL